MIRRAGSLLVLLWCALAALAPSLASAKAIEDVLLGADEQDIMITILADQPLNTPTVRAYQGSIRIRLYDARNTPPLRLTGDGGAVKSVDVTSGSDQTAAIVVNFTDRTRLASTDVRVERDGPKVVLRIARGLLPALREGAVPAAAKQVSPASVPGASVGPKPLPRTEPKAEAKPEPKAEAKPEPKAEAKPEPKAEAKPEPTAEAKPEAEAKPALGAPKPAQAEAKERRLGQGGESSAIPVLLAVSALLALCYGVLRLVMNNKSTIDIPAIDIIAQKRLGPRHQLVIVRAFDRDYLLSIQGGQTTVVARSSRKRTDRAEDMLAPLPFARAPVGDLELAPPTKSNRPEKAPSNTLQPATNFQVPAAARGRDFEDDEVTFGGELFKAALEQRERARDQTSSHRLEAARAEARAELARLEAERDDFSAPKVSLPAAGGNDEPLHEAPKAADAMMSDSVSGLLRLRKAAGR